MDELLQVATKAGQMLLMSGAETYRVEETIVKICQAYHVDCSDAFVLPTGVFVTIIHEGKTYSMNVRIKKRSTDLNMIKGVNQLARDIQTNPISVEELNAKLNDLRKEPKYPWYIVNLAASIGAVGFTFFFGGSVLEAMCAFVAAFLTKSVVDYLDTDLQITPFIYDAVGGGMITFIAFLASMILRVNPDTIIISAIMILVPGIAFTNAIRDSLAGDLVSGVARGVEAILIAIAIALGAVGAIGLIRLLGGVI